MQKKTIFFILCFLVGSYFLIRKSMEQNELPGQANEGKGEGSSSSSKNVNKIKESTLEISPVETAPTVGNSDSSSPVEAKEDDEPSNFLTTSAIFTELNLKLIPAEVDRSGVVLTEFRKLKEGEKAYLLVDNAEAIPLSLSLSLSLSI